MTDSKRQQAFRELPTLIVTNALKLIGAGVFVNEAMFEKVARNSVLAICALFVLGTQVAENILMKAIERMFTTKNNGLPNGHNQADDGSGEK